MSPNDIKHFLVIYDVAAGRSSVREFGGDYESAQAAYAEIEWETQDDPNVEVVLLSADSIETVRRTHSSYFEVREPFERLLPPGILQAH